MDVIGPNRSVYRESLMLTKDPAAEGKAPEVSSNLHERIKGLKNLPPLFRMVWVTDPRTVASTLVLRLVAALLPLGMLIVTRVIIDSIYRLTSQHQALPSAFWGFVFLEFALAGTATVIGRGIDYCETILGDKFTRYISTRTMEHASRLDLTSYEDPLFHDKLERARVQGVDRIGMIQSTGRFIQEVITAASLAASIFIFSPWMLLALVLCVIPAFLGESHFAFLGYSLSFQQTTVRREMDYLRVLGGSKESAKELKLFGLGSFLIQRYTTLSDELHRQTASLAKRRLVIGSLLTLIGTLGYYGAYAFAIYQTVIGVLTLGTLTFLAGAIAGASLNIQSVFLTFSSIADQALFLTDLLDFFSMKPRSLLQTQRASGAQALSAWFRVSERVVCLSRQLQTDLERHKLPAGPPRAHRFSRPEWPGGKQRS
jgi:ATP-binding cassette subfamily B protein